MSSSADQSSKLEGELTTTSSTSESSHKTPLALPDVPHNTTTQLDMSTGSTTVKLDHLGPIVVNVDGTMSRISNWDKMADIEKKNTLRIISKRNNERLAVLKAKEAEGKAS
ncbi:uncharacterized protein PAC_16997 [Phialocephala subalpina]|uniref:Fungal specific transcription factor n=1 Tax=Phialocephala subalpina TaxID=576137 RepID=A0A1L7XQ57_9HELO|nr:uncharacterized protein PAC_16997 [Phialocephala subalpina]